MRRPTSDMNALYARACDIIRAAKVRAPKSLTATHMEIVMECAMEYVRVTGDKVNALEWMKAHKYPEKCRYLSKQIDWECIG